MKNAERWRLARAASASERGRWWLVIGCAAVVGALALSAARMARYRLLVEYDPDGPNVAQLVRDPGTRVGVLTAATLTAVPVVVLLIQALRVGSAQRERRLVALRVVGASRRQLRSVSGLAGTVAGALGGLVAGPLYVVLSAGLFAIPSTYAHLVPRPDRWDGLASPAVVLALALLGWATGWLTARDVEMGPERVALRAPRAVRRSRAVACVALLALIVAGWSAQDSSTADDLGVFVVGLVALAFLVGPYLVLAMAWALSRSRQPLRQLAGARLRAEPRAGGRAAGVVAACGLALSFCGGYVGSLYGTSESWGEDRSYYVSGAAMAGAAVLVSLVVTGLCLAVGAGEQVVEGRRASAVLTAFGVGQRDLAAGVALQMRAVTLPAVTLGAAAGLIGTPLLATGGEPGIGALVGTVVAVASTLAAAQLATALLRPQIRDAASAENLRTA